MLSSALNDIISLNIFGKLVNWKILNPNNVELQQKKVISIFFERKSKKWKRYLVATFAKLHQPGAETSLSLTL